MITIIFYGKYQNTHYPILILCTGVQRFNNKLEDRNRALTPTISADNPCTLDINLVSFSLSYEIMLGRIFGRNR